MVGPPLFLVDNLLHPKEYTRDHEAQQLAKIGDSYTRWQLAHTIGFLALIVFAAAVLGLAFHVRRRRPTLGLVAGALGSWACSAARLCSPSTATRGAS